MKGHEREDLLAWTVKSWSEIDCDIVRISFQRAKLNSIRDSGGEEVQDALEHLNNFDIDNPYLDEVEQEIVDQSELEFMENHE